MNLDLKGPRCPLRDSSSELRNKKTRESKQHMLIFFFFQTGDWHCAYVLLYGPRILELAEDEKNVQPNAVENVTAQSPMETSSSSP